MSATVTTTKQLQGKAWEDLSPASRRKLNMGWIDRLRLELELIESAEQKKKGKKKTER